MEANDVAWLEIESWFQLSQPMKISQISCRPMLRTEFQIATCFENKANLITSTPELVYCKPFKRRIIHFIKTLAFEACFTARIEERRRVPDIGLS